MGHVQGQVCPLGTRCDAVRCQNAGREPTLKKKVRCVNDTHAHDYLTKGEIYEVESEPPSPDGNPGYLLAGIPTLVFWQHRFEVVEENTSPTSGAAAPVAQATTQPSSEPPFDFEKYNRGKMVHK